MDIERVCNEHYQDIIESMAELVQVKSQIINLTNKVESANKVIQDSGREVRTRAAQAQVGKTL